jgi:hypothetical protein
MKCEYCDKKHDESYASGRFCSQKCARGFSSRDKREEINKKVSITLTGRPSSTKGRKYPNRKYVHKRYKAPKIITSYCLNCNIKIIKNKAIKYCSAKCQRDYAYKQYIEQWKAGIQDGHKGLSSISNFIRRYLFEKYEGKCTKCGWHETNPYSKKIPLHIEHKDGNSNNNKEENLDLLCPNCHSLTATFGSLNIGRGRRYYREYKRKRAINTSRL